MWTVAFHGEGDARDEGDVGRAFVVEVLAAEIGGQFTRCLEILSVGTVVEHVFQHFDRGVVVVVAPSVGGGDVSQVAKAVAVILAVLVVEIGLEGGCLLLVEVVVFHEVVASQSLGEDGRALLGRSLHFCLLFGGEEDAAGVDDDGIVVVETCHLFGFHAVDGDFFAVVAQHDVGFLCFQGIHHEDASGSHVMVVDDKAAHHQK